MRELPSPDVLFLPQSRVYNSDLLFDLEEIIDAERPASEVIVEALREKRARANSTRTTTKHARVAAAVSTKSRSQ